MRYLDTGSRNPSSALGTWLREKLSADIVELRCQTGFFSADGVGLLRETLERLARAGDLARFLVGSNDAVTLRDDVMELAAALGLPRSNAALGIVAYAGGFFHPKTFHGRRRDRSEFAYVGSANLTGSGVSSLHIEAGVVLDTADGDPPEILNEVAAAVDEWFTQQRDGLYIIKDVADIDDLVEQRILGDFRDVGLRRSPNAAAAEGLIVRPRLRRLISMPRREGTIDRVEPTEIDETNEARFPPAAPREDFPPYLLFDTSATEPTFGADALTLLPLAGGSAGLVIRLNRDSARHFSGRPGTANLSIPVATAATIRFGVFAGKYLRPRAEFNLRIRYWGDASTFELPVLETNIMPYGFIPGETGHGDLRMLIPGPVRQLAAMLVASGLPTPSEGDYALLEWPTRMAPEMRLTFAQPGSGLYRNAQELFARATEAGALVGDGACWLPHGVAPTW
jgi:hypothetical protein